MKWGECLEEVGPGHIVPYKTVQCPNMFLSPSFSQQTLFLYFFFPQFRKLSHRPSMLSSPSLQQPGFWRCGKGSHLGQHVHFRTCGHHPLLGAACHICCACAVPSELSQVTDSTFQPWQDTQKYLPAFPLQRSVSTKCCVLLLSTCLVPALPHAASAEKCPQVIGKANALSSHAAWFETARSCKMLTFG